MRKGIFSMAYWQYSCVLPRILFNCVRDIRIDHQPAHFIASSTDDNIVRFNLYYKLSFIIFIVRSIYNLCIFEFRHIHNMYVSSFRNTAKRSLAQPKTLNIKCHLSIYRFCNVFWNSKRSHKELTNGGNGDTPITTKTSSSGLCCRVPLTIIINFVKHDCQSSGKMERKLSTIFKRLNNR